MLEDDMWAVKAMFPDGFELNCSAPSVAAKGQLLLIKLASSIILMHQRKTWDLCDLSLPHNQALSFTNIDANSSRSNTRYKSSLASRCGVCQVCTAGWRDGLWVEVWLKHEVGTLLLLPAGWDQLATGRRVCLLHGDQLAATVCFWKQIFVIRIKLTVHLYEQLGLSKGSSEHKFLSYRKLKLLKN